MKQNIKLHIGTKLAGILFSGLLIFSTLPLEALAKTKPISKTDLYGNRWHYDRKTKTLSFSGKGKLQPNRALDGESDEPMWFCWQNDVEHLVIHDGITKISAGDFLGFTKLKTVKLPDTVTVIGNSAFCDCIRLPSVNLPSNLQKIGVDAFNGCELLTKIDIPESVMECKGGAFNACNQLKEIRIPDNVTELGSFSLSNCKNLKRVTLPNSLTTIKGYTFFNCPKLSYIEIPDCVRSIRQGTFMWAGVEKVVLSKNLKRIEKKIGTAVTMMAFFGNVKNYRL